MGLREVFKRFTQKRLTGVAHTTTKEEKKNIRIWKSYKRNFLKAMKKSNDDVSWFSIKLFDTFAYLDPTMQLQEWDFFESACDELVKDYNIDRFAPMIRQLGSDSERETFINNKFGENFKKLFMQNKKCLSVFDNQVEIANLYLNEQLYNKKHYSRVDDFSKNAEKYMQTLAETGETEKVSNFIGALLQRKGELPQEFVTSIIRQNPNIVSANQICEFVNGNFKDKNGNYLPNVNILAIQRECANRVLAKYRDPKDGLILEKHRTQILIEMAEVNRQFGGNVYLDFANETTKTEKNILGEPLIRNNDLFAYCENSRQCDEISHEDRRVNLEDIKNLHRQSFNIKTLDEINKEKLISILVQDDFTINRQNGLIIDSTEIDGIVENYYGIKPETKEYQKLINGYSQEIINQHSVGYTTMNFFYNRVGKNGFKEIDTSSKFNIAVAKKTAPSSGLNELALTEFFEKVEQAETLVASQEEAIDNGIIERV